MFPVSAHERIVGIEDAAYVLPGEPHTLDEWLSARKANDALSERLRADGYRYYYHADGLTAADLARQAVRVLLDRGALEPASVGLVLYTHVLPASIPAPPESLPARLAVEFGFRGAACFTVSQLHCSSLIACLTIVRDMMASNPGIENALIVSSDVVLSPELTHRNQRNVVSDAGAVMWLRRNARRNFIGPIELQSLTEFHDGYNISDAMNNKFNQLVQLSTVRVLQRTLERCSLPKEKITRFVPPNFSSRAWPVIVRVLGREPGFVFDENIAPKAHALCSDVAINLVDGGFLDPGPGTGVVVHTRGRSGAYGAFTLQSRELQ